MTGAAFEFPIWFSGLPFILAAATFTWLLSLPLRNVSIVDSLWSLMLFMAGVVYALNSDPRAPRLSLVLWLLAIWAARLSLHGTLRGAGGERRRYQQLRERNQPGFAWKSLYLCSGGRLWPGGFHAVVGAFGTIGPGC